MTSVSNTYSAQYVCSDIVGIEIIAVPSTVDCRLHVLNAMLCIDLSNVLTAVK